MVKTETSKTLIKNKGIDFFLPKPDFYKLLFSCIINWIWITTEFLIDRNVVSYCMLMPKYQKQPRVYYRSVLQWIQTNKWFTKMGLKNTIIFMLVYVLSLHTLIVDL